ncbi:MAG: OmpA family protein [Acidobacteria bacterium]|jgi:outer membrane protein OmpA-like peptidoglycan-associated protein|nr:OmpA family protein [Acidobacteriota bacterium]
MKRSILTTVVVMAGLALVAGGCATKTYVNDQVAQYGKATDAKVGEVQKQVESTQMEVATLKKSDAAQTEQLGKLSDTAKEALARAQEAGKLAQGKLIYEVALTDDQVRFGLNSSELSAEAKAALDAIAAKLKADNQGVYIEIQGHTDGSGSDDYNLALGARRAESVMRYLSTQAGLPLHRMNSISYGESKPIADNNTRDGRATNRRVVLVVLI